MTDFKIVCTTQVPLTQPSTHAHIVCVGVDKDYDGWADEKHSKEQVIRNIEAGHRYYTIGKVTKKTAFVEVVKCPYGCGLSIIRSKRDATRDNNLDYIRRCDWVG